MEFDKTSSFLGTDEFAGDTSGELWVDFSSFFVGECGLKSESDLSKSNKPKLSIIKKSPFSQISRKLLAKTS